MIGLIILLLVILGLVVLSALVRLLILWYQDEQSYIEYEDNDTLVFGDELEEDVSTVRLPVVS